MMYSEAVERFENKIKGVDFEAVYGSQEQIWESSDMYKVYNEMKGDKEMFFDWLKKTISILGTKETKNILQVMALGYEKKAERFTEYNRLKGKAISERANQEIYLAEEYKNRMDEIRKEYADKMDEYEALYPECVN